MFRPQSLDSCTRIFLKVQSIFTYLDLPGGRTFSAAAGRALTLAWNGHLGLLGEHQQHACSKDRQYSCRELQRCRSCRGSCGACAGANRRRCAALAASGPSHWAELARWALNAGFLASKILKGPRCTGCAVQSHPIAGRELAHWARCASSRGAASRAIETRVSVTGASAKIRSQLGGRTISTSWAQRTGAPAIYSVAIASAV